VATFSHCRYLQIFSNARHKRRVAAIEKIEEQEASWEKTTLPHFGRLAPFMNSTIRPKELALIAQMRPQQAVAAWWPQHKFFWKGEETHELLVQEDASGHPADSQRTV
jgi:hypothetical protein